MSPFCRPLCVAVLLGLSASCGRTPAGPATPPETEPTADAGSPAVPTGVLDAATVTPPPSGQADAGAASPDEASLPPPAGGSQVVVEAGDSDRENTGKQRPYEDHGERQE